MDPVSEVNNGMGNEEQPSSSGDTLVYPPKYERSAESSNVWLRSMMSLAAYLLLGYYIFPNYKVLLIITGIVMIHELGHFLAMRYFRYNDLGIFFIPLLGAYVSGTKREVSQSQSAVILLAGPLPGVLFGIILYLLDQPAHTYEFLDISLSRIGLIFIILNLINLLPVYPLDGGQLLNRVFLDEEGFWSRIFVFLSAGMMVWFAWSMYNKTGSSFYFIFFLFPVMMLFRRFGETKMHHVEKKVEEAGIHTDIDYEDLPDEDYWKIRNIVVREYPLLKDVPQAPPFEFSHKEEKVMTVIQSLLHRHLIQDVSIAGKILIFLIWVAALASPWLLNLQVWSMWGPR